MPTFRTQIWPGGKGPAVEARVEAKTSGEAKRLFEAQYGKASVKGSVYKV